MEVLIHQHGHQVKCPFYLIEDLFKIRVGVKKPLHAHLPAVKFLEDCLERVGQRVQLYGFLHGDPLTAMSGGVLGISDPDAQPSLLCCGKIEDLIPSWLSCGFDGWDSVMACNDLKKIKKEYGDRMIFMPGLDTQQILGPKGTSRGMIERMVVDWMEMLAGDGTGLIIDSTVAYSLNPENEEICLEYIRKHGRRFMDAKKAGVPYVPDLEDAG